MNQMTRITAVPAQGFSARFTTAEFLRMIEADVFEDWKVELVDGELHRMPLPDNDHARVQVALLAGLLDVAERELVRGGVGIALEEGTLVGCDAALLRAPLTGRRMLQPDDLALVVEVADTTLHRDLGMKRRRYAEARIPNYWVVDGSRSVVHVHADPIDGEYVDIHTVRFGQPLAVPGSSEVITLG